MEKISIIGSGVIGRQWATLFLGAGFKVYLYDISEDQLKVAVQETSKLIEQLQHDGLARSNVTVDGQMKNLYTTKSLEECLKDAIYVQECVPEILDNKIQVWAQIDNTLSNVKNIVDKKSIILASSSSALPANKISEGLSNMKNRFLVAHPINPPIYCKLVELVPCSNTDPDVVDRAYQLMTRIGQAPTRVNKDIQGYILNRLQYAVLAESWHLVAEGIISVDDLSTVMTEGLAPRYAFFGPLEVAHMNANGIEDFAHKYNKISMALGNTYNPITNFEDEQNLKIIKEQLEAKVPLHKLNDMRQDRDKKLAELAKFKNRFL